MGVIMVSVDFNAMSLKRLILIELSAMLYEDVKSAFIAVTEAVNNNNTGSYVAHSQMNYHCQEATRQLPS
jgi:hypothetical protein